MRIPFHRVSCGVEEFANVREVLESGWVTTASKAQALEEGFVAATGAKFALAVNSGTSALHLALEALGIGAGDEVLVPTMTFTATAEVVRYLGADPVFLDVDYGTAMLTPELVDTALDAHPSAKALIVVHYGGQVARMAGAGGILDLCAKRGVRVVEDAAHAFPARRDGLLIGNMGDATCFSFYANKTITAGEGGMLVTNDAAVAERAKVMRLHGIDRDIWTRFTSDAEAWEYDVVAPGFKYNLSDINAAVAVAQLAKAEDLRRERQRCASHYRSSLREIGGLDLPRIEVADDEHSWHLYAVVVNDRAPIGRNDLIKRLTDRGIGTSVHYKPLHRMTYYRDRYGLSPASFPQAERLWRGTISLPVYPDLTDEDLAYTVDCLRELLG